MEIVVIDMMVFDDGFSYIIVIFGCNKEMIVILSTSDEFFSARSEKIFVIR